MAEKTSIEWTDATWNPITGCSVVSPGCTNCYAMKLAGTRLRDHPSRARLTQESKAGPVWNGEVRFNEQWLDQPLRWKRPRRIFVCAHGDLFHENVPDDWIDAVFAAMALAQHHTFQVLTKRPERMRRYINSRNLAEADNPVTRWALRIAFFVRGYGGRGGSTAWPLPNVWLGVSAEDQVRADERIPHLLATPAAVRFVSAEPLVEAINFRWAPYAHQTTGESYREYLERTGCVNQYEALRKLDWVIVGGESGPGARPMHPDWARSLRDQCAAAGVPFFFKQWGEWSAIYDRDRDDPDWRNCPRNDAPNRRYRYLNLAGGHGFHGERVVYVKKTSKAAAGRLLDGREHDAVPATEGS